MYGHGRGLLQVHKVGVVAGVGVSADKLRFVKGLKVAVLLHGLKLRGAAFAWVLLLFGVVTVGVGKRFPGA